MKMLEAISLADSIKPNAFSRAVKLHWLNSLEGRIAAEVLLASPADLEALTLKANSERWELLVKPPYDDIYTAWLKAQIDLNNGEYNKYQNSMQEFNALWNSFVCWFANTYEPGRGYLLRALEKGGS